MYNVLFFGGGRRWQLAQCFEHIGFGVVCFENGPDSPLKNMGYTHTWAAKDTNTVDKINSICNTHDIDLILPLHEKTVLALAEAKNCLHCEAVVSSLDTTNNCYDKANYERLFGDHSNYPSINRSYPQIRKPRHGWGSNGITVFRSWKEEYSGSHDKKNYIRQSYIRGKEYTVDAYFDKQGCMVDAVPRVRLRVADGEVIESVTEHVPELYDLTKEFGTKLGIIGPCCLQWIKCRITGTYYFIEANARFGGGVTLSIYSGFNMVDLLVREYVYDENIIENYTSAWKTGQYMRRVYKDTYDQ